MQHNKINIWIRIGIAVCGVALFAVQFVPIWRIDLDAPQYPEGLYLLIFSNKLGGNVEIINGLNHYIGMKTLHANDFLEFTVLPYIIGFYAIFAFAVAALGNKKMLYVLFIAFLIFGVVAMIDFWRWEYNYGHNLDPNAAIIVPGMAYQPPLIGFKQLLNFGAYSIPDIGGWIFVVVGIIWFTLSVWESGLIKKFSRKSAGTVVSLILFVSLTSCTQNPEPIKVHKDQCRLCKMSISDIRYGCELVTPKGRTLKFDDLKCLMEYRSAAEELLDSKIFFYAFNEPSKLMSEKEAILLQGSYFTAPMGGDIIAVSNQKAAEEFLAKEGVIIITFKDLRKP